ncbi:MAG: bifunctional 2-C-methyl-D-erythritol 4-phosphate cytidylyltransferase/2-C-methyl-D-erythritol 2,4-cyclodiphosphate synthase [Rhodospirillaceae bacterium]
MALKIAALIVAAGRGRRFAAELPKQYHGLAGRPVLRHSLARFAAHPEVALVRTVIHPDDRSLYDECAHGLSTLLDPIHGGAERQDSVRLGLESLEEYAPDYVLIHDGARPMVDFALIDRVIVGLSAQAGALPALAVADTLKRGNGVLVEATVDRTGLYRAQTPQGFRYADILAAHRAAEGQALTDDAVVLEASGGRVGLIEGSEDNFKVTRPEDLARAERLLTGSAETRLGNGYDVHAFEPGDYVTLCGVEIPHNARLKGHSDADVAMHAVTDALLGAIGGGDIGRHFPPSDQRWRGAPSTIFLAHAGALIEALGGRILNIDLTVICEAPKVGPHRAAMVRGLADALGISANRISVKATTSEGLGFTGRQEGIAAIATAAVEVPGLG